METGDITPTISCPRESRILPSIAVGVRRRRIVGSGSERDRWLTGRKRNHFFRVVSTAQLPPEKKKFGSGSRAEGYGNVGSLLGLKDLSMDCSLV
ncbi:hypothetical protein IEQ34_016185 [Dendrobium chrysotoxum]|uniref:Uncharacterized protein n=1 Tax=Dendrobium chrysotoxum TaxID=161865 RepID=A0AAV7GCT0_DENCH|nr:hypothetical protein IEQ34_016185 [Dendrobium chrysotoxum]